MHFEAWSVLPFLREEGGESSMEAPVRRAYPSAVSDDEWAFVAP